MIKKKISISRYLSLFFIASIYLFLYVPIIVLIIFSFNTKRFPSHWDHFTFRWYYELFNSTELWQSFLHSLTIATCATLLSLTMAALLIFFRSMEGRRFKLLPLFYGNLLIPETVLAVSLLGYFTFFKVPLGLPTLVVSHTILGLGFVVPILYTRYLELDSRMIEASFVLGATPFQTFFKIILPLLRPTMIASGLLAFVVSFDDFILSYFCAGQDFQTLSLYLLSKMRLGISPVVNALSTLLLFLSASLVFFVFTPKLRHKIL